MNDSEFIQLIRESFEAWYNRDVSPDFPVSIAINYSDEQTLAIKAIHTSRMQVTALGIRDGMSYTRTLIALQENYNHGTTSSSEAKMNIVRKLLVELYSYRRR